MKTLLLLSLFVSSALGQTAGQYGMTRKNSGAGFTTIWTTVGNDYLFAANGSGVLTPIPKSTFEPAFTIGTGVTRTGATLSVNMAALTPSWSGITGKPDFAATYQPRGDYPVFEIRVPAGYVEVQVRASLTNFEPGFLLKDGANFVLNYIPTGATVAGRKVFKAMGTGEVATWNVGTNRWTFGYKSIYSTSTSIAPWDIPGESLIGTPTGTFLLQKEYFVYRTCTTGSGQDSQWGQGSGDPDPWTFIANQSATPGSNTEYKRQKLIPNATMQSQLQAAGTPGYTIMFQPSRGNLGAIEWMSQKQDKLVWIYQVQDGSGNKPRHPNGTDVWNTFYPQEWRKSRITLFVP